ncbi:ABC transporter ATP-binding protein [Seonamhaeicola algicola]|uniref:ABC transporter ATP-binding protein n=1 Tax=Seonamhaeicola algicola TaxID=1719036 RepID=A0A5C7AK81_9FLAO|nr:ABC transporter ATP-binding protein [Seonamhaeicola algicola]TXE06172.1 ABC transporter ATP-binding protein [Seonamhaeicola algicola]
MKPIIKLKNLTKKYGDFIAVNNLNIEIKKGEIFGLLGPNGAGKSTTILMLLGLTEPSNGNAWVCNYNATKNPIEVKKHVGYLPDNLGFYNNRTGLENLIYIARLNNIPTEIATKKAKELLTRVGLDNNANQKVGTYSRGMKQRLGLADILIKNPSVIILDEPTLGLDPKGIKEFLQLIYKLSKEEGITVLLSSHHLHQVQQVCDRVGLFVDGNLIAQGDINTLAKSIFNEESHTIEIKLKENHESNLNTIKNLLIQNKLASKVSIISEKLIINCSDDNTTPIVKSIVNANFNINHLHVKSYGLDDIYQRYF